MSSIISKCQTGFLVTNLVLRDCMWGNPQPEFLYNINNTPINAISFKEMFQNERDPTVYIYSPISSFFINPNGKQIIPVCFKVENESYLDVILYQEDENGKLFRLTSISEKILRSNSSLICKPFNHSSLKLINYEEKDMLYYEKLIEKIKSDLTTYKANLEKNEEKISHTNVLFTTYIFPDVFGFSTKRLSSL